MMLRSTAIVALAAASVHAFAARNLPPPREGRAYEVWVMPKGSAQPQPSELRALPPNLPSAAPRPPNHDMRMAPSMGGHAMRGMRMNGGMGRR
jgi:hypothetical protein